ncbi:MAG TPA: TolC family protein [Guyparkeria sp.]|nr:TolC family protein [Guyparkeria sp.]
MPLTFRLPRACRARCSLLLSSLFLLAPINSSAADWTLTRTAERALAVAPELDAAQAEHDRRAGLADEAGRWPNPSLEVSFSDELGIEDGSGGWSLQEYSILQPLPIDGRIRHRADAADKRTAVATARQLQHALTVEHRAALSFHQLQWAEARIRQALAQQTWTQRFAQIGDRRAHAGDLSERERLRLNLLHAEAEAELDQARQAHEAALADYHGLLAIDRGQSLSVPELSRAERPPAIETLRQRLEQHPTLRAAAGQVAAARAEVEQMRAERLPDLSLRMARERVYIDGRDQNTHHVGLQIELPFWSQGRGRVDASRSNAIREDAERQVTQRDLGLRLERSHQQLTRLLERINQHRTTILDPAETVLEQTRKGFEQGELRLTELIDAAQARIRATRQHLDLLLEARTQESDLRLAAGWMLTTDNLELTR